MPVAQPSPVRAPNQSLTTLAAKMSSRPAPGAPDAHPPNDRLHDGDPGMGNPTARLGSPIMPPNSTRVFRPGDGTMAQPDSVVTPGQGAIPVEGFTVNGTPARVKVAIPDTAKKSLAT